MVKPTNTSAITKATNRPWDDWVAALDAAGAREMNHGDIAKQALKLMPEPVEQKGWWAQGVAIAYEQHAGLRVPGETSTGSFQTSTSKTFPGDKDAALKAWLDLVSTRTEFNGIDIVEAEISPFLFSIITIKLILNRYKIEVYNRTTSR